MSYAGGAARCEDCGILLDRHGEDCGFEAGDERAPSFGRPAGWLGPNGFVPMDAPVPDAQCGRGHALTPMPLRGVLQLDSGRHFWVYRCPVDGCGREAVVCPGLPRPVVAFLVDEDEDDTKWPGRWLTPDEVAALGDILQDRE